MHKNSLQAYGEIQPQIGRRHKMVLRAVTDLKRATDRQILQYLNLREPNQVRPRITELIKCHQLQECGTARDELTGKNVRIVRLPEVLIQQNLL